MVKILILLILSLNALVMIWPLLPTRRKPRWIDFLPAVALGLCVRDVNEAGRQKWPLAT